MVWLASHVMAGVSAVALLLAPLAPLAPSIPEPARAPNEIASSCVTDNGALPGVSRIGGSDRYEVSAANSAGDFLPEIAVAYVASGVNFPDALSGSAAAGFDKGPLLLTEPNQLPEVIKNELIRLRPTAIVILGGPSSVSSSVERALGQLARTVTRYGGADRYAVSAEVSTGVFHGGATTVYVASGAVFPDALSASAAAGLERGPVLLVRKDALPESVRTALQQMPHLERIVVVGGRETIADSVIVELAEFARVDRVDGADRFAVSAAVSLQSFCGDRAAVFIASGTVFPDALSGSTGAIYWQGPLVTNDSIPQSVETELRRLNPKHIFVLGGPATVSANLESALASYVRK